MINKISSAQNTIYKNKTFLKILKYSQERPALVEKGATLILSALVRPISIMMTPNTDKREKQYLFAKSFASGIIGFTATAMLFQPVAKAVDLISKQPDKFLTKSSINNLSKGAKTLNDSPAFNFLGQSVKYIPAFISVIPKALLTTALITPIVEIVFRKNKSKPNDSEIKLNKSSGNIQSFKGREQKLAKIISKPLNNKSIQKFAIKHQNSNLFLNMMSVKDLFATGVFALFTAKNKKIEKKDKKTLIMNSFISTVMTLGAGYFADKLTKKPMDKFLGKLAKINSEDVNMPKYIEGAKVLKPIAILGSLYYVIIPVISTFLSGKLLNKEGQNGKLD